MSRQPATASATASPPQVATTVVASKSQRAYDWIRERILSKEFGSGYRLVLAPIAGELQMSAIPVREAIRRLEAEGAVTYVHNVGAQVTMLDKGVYRDTMQTLGLVEGFATALSAPHLTDAELDEAAAINAEMRAMTDTGEIDAPAFTRLNQRFHGVLFQHCTNEHVADLVRRGWHRLETMRESAFAFVPARTAESVDEHDRILELIRGGADVDRVEHEARRHRINTMTAVLAAISPDGE